MATPKAPAGGFQNGGWYDGRQYWNGTFGAPGVGNNPNQTDIYQKAAPTFSTADANYIKQQQQTYTPSTPSTPAAQPTTTASTTPTGGAGPSVFAPAPLDLNATYQNLVSSAGLTAKDQEIAQKRQQASEAKAKINDNPFLSEATRVGRVAKIDQLANDTIGNLQNEVATKRADIEMQMGFQTRQFELNSQASRDNLDQFNSLLKMGAFDNASPDEIANITRSTGLSSGIIANAINAKKIAGNQSKIESFDDGTNQGFIIYMIDPLGNVVSQSKQVVGPSVPKAKAFDSNAFIQGLGNMGADTSNPDSLW